MGHKSEQQQEPADVATEQVGMDNDYQTELPKGSTSSNAAKAGEDAVVASQDEASPFRLPAMHLSGEHAREKAEAFRTKANAYNLSRYGKGAGKGAYKNLTDQAEKYDTDATALESANAAYNQLVPQSAFALDSVVRFKAIQAELGLDFSDNSMWTVTEGDLSGHVGDRKGDFASGISDSAVKTNKGLVSDAARSFSAAQSGLYAAMSQLQGMRMRQLLRELKSKREEAKEKKEEIEIAIESAQSVTEFVGKALGIGGESYKVGMEHGAKGGEHEHGSHEHAEGGGGLEMVKTADEAAGMALGVIMHAIHDDELAEISTQIAGLSSHIEGLGGLIKSTEFKAIQQLFDAARGTYTAALHHYENALANQRTAYAKAGANADKIHAHGASLKHGNDKASQTMLFISAARETDVVLNTALPLGQHVEGELHQALKGMRHRVMPFLEDDWRSGTPEGSRAADQQQAQQAYALTSKWVAATEKEKRSFDPIEEASRKMLQRTGKTAGEY